jgi:hypothetical protein
MPDIRFDSMYLVLKKGVDAVDFIDKLNKFIDEYCVDGCFN